MSVTTRRILSLILSIFASSTNSLSSVPAKKIALVTGANKGIGREIARKIGEGGKWCVLLGCRDAALGCAAAADFDFDCEVVRLDLNDQKSIDDAAAYVDETYGGLDALVNNAAVCYNSPTLYGKVEHTPFEKQARITIDTNFFGSLAVTRAFLPLLLRRTESTPSSSTPARIVNVASSAGRLSLLRAPELAAAFTDPALQLDRLEALMREFVHAAEAGTHAEQGWPNTGYGVSKIGIIAMTRVLAHDNADRIMVNSVDPGYCQTDQNDNQGTQDAAVGAAVPAALVGLGSDGDRGDATFITGKHLYFDGREIDWLSS